MADDSVRAVLRDEFGLSSIESLERIDNGDWNRIYRVDAQATRERGDDRVDGAGWILRISHPRKSLRQLEFELNLLAALRERGAPVAAVRRSHAGELFATRDGELFTLFERVPGAAFVITDKSVREAGRLLGELHRHLVDLSGSLRFVGNFSMIGFDWGDNLFFTGDVLNPYSLDVKLPAGQRGNQKELLLAIPQLRSVREDLMAWTATATHEDRFTESIIHGDYYRRNLVASDGRIAGVIDWDETTTSWLEYEVANATWEFARDDDLCVIDGDRSARFLAGYRETGPVDSPDEIDFRRLIAVRRIIEIQASLFDLSGDGEADLDYCTKNVRHLFNLQIE